jgi:SAM-dependent methyltransferase
MRLNDRELVQREYANEERLATRRKTIARFLEGPDAAEVAFGAVAEAMPRRVLEVGCGLGAFAERLTGELDAHVLAVDLSTRMVELARARGVDARLGDVQELPFADGEFDCTVANWMLYHVPDVDRAIAELARVVRPGGRLVAATGSPDNLLELRELLGAETRPRQAFDSENGAELLQRHFGEVERRYVEAALVFPDQDALRTYVEANILLGDLADNVPPLTEPFRAPTRQTVFVATR